MNKNLSGKEVYYSLLGSTVTTGTVLTLAKKLKKDSSIDSPIILDVFSDWGLYLSMNVPIFNFSLIYIMKRKSFDNRNKFSELLGINVLNVIANHSAQSYATLTQILEEGYSLGATNSSLIAATTCSVVFPYSLKLAVDSKEKLKKTKLYDFLEFKILQSRCGIKLFKEGII